MFVVDYCIWSSLVVLTILADEVVAPLEDGACGLVPLPVAMATSFHADTVTHTVQEAAWVTARPVGPGHVLVLICNRGQ